MSYLFIFIPFRRFHLVNLRLFYMLFFSQLACPKPSLFILFSHKLKNTEGISIYLVFSSNYSYKHKFITILEYCGFPLYQIFKSEDDFYKHLVLSKFFLKGVFLENSQLVFSNYSFASLSIILKKYLSA